MSAPECTGDAMSSMSPRVKDLLHEHLDTIIVIAHEYRQAMKCDTPAVVLLDLTDAEAFGVAATIARHDDSLLITHGQGWARAEHDAKVLEELRRRRDAGTPVALAIPAEMAQDLTLCGDPIEPGTFLAVVMAEGGCWNKAIPLHQDPAKP